MLWFGLIFLPICQDHWKCGILVWVQLEKGGNASKSKQVLSDRVVDRWVQVNTCPTVCQHVGSHRSSVYPDFSCSFSPRRRQHVLPSLPPELTETHPERSFQASPDVALPHRASASVARRHVSAPGTMHYWVNLLRMLLSSPLLLCSYNPVAATC